MKIKSFFALLLSFLLVPMASAGEILKAKTSDVMPASHPSAESGVKIDVEPVSKTVKMKNDQLPAATIKGTLNPLSNKEDFTLKIDNANNKTGARDISFKYKGKTYTVNVTAAQMENLPDTGLTFVVEGNKPIKLSINFAAFSGPSSPQKPKPAPIYFRYIISQIEIG